MIKSIQNDLSPGKCAINLKRTDAHWTEWSDPESISSGEFRGINRLRECIGDTHGGKTDDCSIGRKSETVVFGLHHANRADAAIFCDEMVFTAGDKYHLFFGQADQLLMTIVSNHFGGRNFWVGVSNYSNGFWEDMEGNNVNGLIPWDHNEPNGVDGHEPCVIAIRRDSGVFLHDYIDQGHLPFACESWR